MANKKIHKKRATKNDDSNFFNNKYNVLIFLTLVVYPFTIHPWTI